MNSIGQLFRVSLYGESHGKKIGVIIDGCPPGICLTEHDFINDLSRRKSGAKGTTPRTEDDIPDIVSGVFKGKTTGAPINIEFENKNIKSVDYSDLSDIPRPGHADFVSSKKYLGFNDPRGGGHSSGRLTLGIVAAGVIAKKIISPIEIKAQILEIGGKKDYKKKLENAIEAGDSLGGIVECVATNLPVGLGEPFFNSVESLISHAVFSIPAVKGIEFGMGFKAASVKGSEYNDLIMNTNGKTMTNNDAGINGGITNGNDIVFRVAVKPTPSISILQKTINMKTGKITDLKIKGRHDACIAIRIPVVIEAATSIVLADLYLQNK